MKIDNVDQEYNMFEDIKETHVTMEDAIQIPEPGDAVRTKKMQMEGKVEKVERSRAGYDEVFFRVADGRLMKTPLDNVIIIQKLADEDHEIMEAELNEISSELLGRYKTAAGKQASEADKKGDFKKGDKRFSGIVKATKKQFDNDAKKQKDVKEGGMGGVNRSAPSNDVSYERILNDVTDKWRGSTVKVKEDKAPTMTYKGQIDPWHGYAKNDPTRAGVKTPKSSMQGSDAATFSEMVRDTIRAHGLKWAFDYYVKKNGLPPRHFKIFAGL